MARKDSMDLSGAAGLTVFAAALAFNQVIIKLSNAGIAPVFGAGLRSFLALLVLGGWCFAMRRAPRGLRATLLSGLALGTLFSLEFIFLFSALDLTTVSRASIAFYCMPVWLAGIAHFALPGERLSPRRLLGLGLAVAGVIWALADPQSRGAGNLRGDLMAVCASLSWAGIALVVRLTRVSEISPESQLVWQLGVSAVVLTLVGWATGPLWREPDPLAFVALGYGVVVASLGFLFWLRLMTIYPASDVASFSFLSPVLAVGFGWLVFDEPVSGSFFGAMVMVAVGIVLINRRRPGKAVQDKRRGAPI